MSDLTTSESVSILPVGTGEVRTVPVSLIDLPDTRRRITDFDRRNAGETVTVRLRTDKNGDHNGLFELISGEDALRCAVADGKTEIRCVVTEPDEREKTAAAIIDRLRRGNLSMFDEAEAFAVLREGGMTQDEIARRMGRSQSLVANKIRLLQLTGDERRIILQNRLTERHARTFLRIPESETRLGAIREAARRRLNVAATEELVDGIVRSLPDPTDGESPRKVSRFLLRDVRPFFNTVNRAAEMMNEAGFHATVTTRENDEETIVTIRLTR